MDQKNHNICRILNQCYNPKAYKMNMGAVNGAYTPSAAKDNSVRADR